MDCLQAREIVSEAFDRGLTDTPGVAEAREHCRGCAECAAFVQGLVALQKAPAPQAPASVVDAILDRTRKMAALDAEEAAAARPVTPAPVATTPESTDQGASAPVAPSPPAPTGWESDLGSPVPPRPRPRLWWLPRTAAGLAAAAVVIVALVVSFQGFRALAPGGGTPASAPVAREMEPATEAAKDVGTSSHSATSGNRFAAGPSQAATSSVRYVAFDGQAYVWLGERSPDKSSLVAAGTLMSSFATTDAPVSRQVWRSKTDPDLIFLEPAIGTMTAFQRVTRTLGGKKFALSAESGLDAYGQWPALPSRFIAPTSDDGSPTFQAAGTDDTGLKVYTPPGASPAQGFAVAPGTSGADPAGGDPDWTWWVPAQ